MDPSNYRLGALIKESQSNGPIIGALNRVETSSLQAASLPDCYPFFDQLFPFLSRPPPLKGYAVRKNQSDRLNPGP
ncbi:MAG: hypothetical protein DSY87_09485 [Methylococcus sp.]|nr:MAG: hypothetical protein DSY87_09485 [Methylococcus sp.]